MKAVWNDVVIAESEETIVVEGSHYFPPDSVQRNHLRDSSTHTMCGWKGQASYYDVVANGECNADAAWFYPDTMEAANNIRDYVAFWKGVEVTP
jgi:uncharacterized protein (DUF427 family)